MATSVGMLKWVESSPDSPGVPRVRRSSPIGGELADDVEADIGEPDVAFVVDADVVSLAHLALAPGADELAVDWCRPGRGFHHG